MAKTSLDNFYEVDNNPEIKAFVIMQSFDVKKYDSSINVRCVYYDKSRDKWIARYKTNAETSIIKSVFKRFDTQEEAETFMYEYKRDIMHKLLNKYPHYFVRETLRRRVESGKADNYQKAIYEIIYDWDNDEIIDYLITTKNILNEQT